MLKRLEAYGWPAGEREAIVETFVACPGFVSRFAVSLQNGGAKYPAFIHLASQIDLLEQALNVQQARNNLRG
jgi:hypothetical protein